MDEEVLLLNPGPVPVAREVRKAMDAPMISRRSAAFGEIYDRARDGLEYVFTESTPDGSSTAVDGRVLILNGTATMGMEAAVANLVSEGNEIVAVVNGKFGERFADIAAKYGSLRAVEFEWGRSIDPAVVDDAVSDATELVLMVHNETSTGLMNPVEQVGAIAADHDAYFVVDGVSSVGGTEFRIDDWGVDVAITDPQKALASPPGISAMYASEAALDGFDGTGAPYYQNLADYAEAARDRRTPFTCASPQFRALAVAVDLIRAEGMSERIRRHRRLAGAIREGVRAMGLETFPEVEGGTTLSNTLTAVALPAALRDDPSAFFDAAEARGVSFGGGLDHLDGHLFRVSNMGHLSTEQVLFGLETIGDALGDAGVSVETGAGAAAAREKLNGF